VKKHPVLEHNIAEELGSQSQDILELHILPHT